VPEPERSVAVLVPIKGFDAAKARLAGAVDAAERSRLAREMASRVVRAAVPLPVWVVCDDPEVARWAEAQGAGVCHQVEPGLDAAVSGGVRALGELGFERVIVAHADLPRATSLAHLADGEPQAVVIVPDRHRDGSNVLVVPTAAGFRFAYGPGSFRAHAAEAERLGLGLVVVDDPDLAWDVDVPDDLTGLDVAADGENS
jgi:2-phospho-L-lactate/phosphoenolpyruvate guanylyltransferase